jgi:hypothetical protein
MNDIAIMENDIMAIVEFEIRMAGGLNQPLIILSGPHNLCAPKSRLANVTI